MSVVGSGAKRYLVIEAGADDPSTVVAQADNGSGKIANKLGFDAAGAANAQQYALGALTRRQPPGLCPGRGRWTRWDPTQANNGIATALIGDENAKIARGMRCSTSICSPSFAFRRR